MSDEMKEPRKVVALHGGDVPSPEATKAHIFEHVDRARRCCAERKIVAVGVACVDADGLEYVFYARDACRSTMLTGAIEYMKWRVLKDLDEDMMSVDPEEKK